MFSFSGKVIVIVSQQDWGKMFISKHHYAAELARAGNTVYYLEGPAGTKVDGKNSIRIDKTDIENLYVVKHSLFYPTMIKHKLYLLHRQLIKVQVSRLIDRIGKDVDVVWSFDMSATIPLSAFPARALKILMPVDEHNNQKSYADAHDADVIISVTNEILDKYTSSGKPRLFANHGVQEKFVGQAVSYVGKPCKHVGLSGNFLRPDIDWDVLLQVMNTHEEITFHFYGSYKPKDGNLTAHANYVLDAGLAAALDCTNAKFYGIVSPTVLADELKKMDAFFICYDIDKDQSKGTNYHKVLEYLATGKVIVSNNITTYSNTGLVAMPEERHNKNLPRLFQQVVENLEQYNSMQQQQFRIDYAEKHTYGNNIRRIEDFVNTHTKINSRQQ